MTTTEREILIEQAAILDHMREYNIPSTRENYIAVRHGPYKSTWTADDELALPEEFRVWMKEVDYIQDPSTGRFEGSRPQGGDEDEGAGGGSVALRPAGDRASWPAHIKALRIPPAWTNVRIADDPKANLLVIGIDAKGRSQYVYSQAHSESTTRMKFEKTRELIAKLSKVRAENLANAGNRDQKLKDHAECMQLVIDYGIRPGSDSDTKADVQAYGATTLQGRHVKDGGRTLTFVGKKGVSVSIAIKDDKVAQMLAARAKEAGSKGKLFPSVSQSSLLEYSNSLDGGGFRTKDFRTALGTQVALQEMQKLPAPKNEKSYKKAVREVAKAVSAKLGNTPIVALKSYIDATVFSPWREASGVT